MVSLGPKKDGGPNVEFFQSPESMQGFETIRQWLQKNCKKVSSVHCIYVVGRSAIRSTSTSNNNNNYAVVSNSQTPIYQPY